MNNLHTLKQTAASLLLTVGAIGAAQAGLLTGSADPLFGASLPGISYRVDFSVFVPDVYFNTGVADANTGLLKVPVPLLTQQIALNTKVTLINTVAHTSAFTNFSFLLGELTFDTLHSNVLVGWKLRLPVNPQPDLTGKLADFAFPTQGGKNKYGFDFTWSSLDVAPQLRYFTRVNCPSFNLGLKLCAAQPMSADLTGMVVSYVDRFDPVVGENAGVNKLGTTPNGQDQAVQYSYTSNTQRSATAFGLPEPDSIALVLAALAGGAWVRRRANRAS